MGVTPEPAPQTKTQPELPGMDAACASVGLADIPAGFAKLTKKQREFTLAYLRTGNSTAAAREAGYSDPESDGTKVKKAPEVAAILAQAGIAVAKDADQLIKRASIRSRALHQLFEAELAKPETLRSTAQLLKLSAELNRADGLLGSLIGKITGIHHTGEVKHTHGGAVAAITVPAAALNDLAAAHREVVATRLGQINGGAN